MPPRQVHMVTGAGRGIGFAVARHLVDTGSAVVLIDNGCRVDGTGEDASVAEAAADALGGNATAVAADVRDAAAIIKAVEDTIDRLGQIDGIVNAAAVLRTGNILTTTDADWRSTLDVNVTGSMLVSRAAIGCWIDTGTAGRIVNITSAAGLEGIPEMFAYSTSKAAVIGMTMAAANAVAAHGIRVNAVAPLAATRMTVRGLGQEAMAVRQRTGAWPDLAPTGITANRVAPLVRHLLAPTCTVTGRVFTAAAGVFERLSLPGAECSVRATDDMPSETIDALLTQSVTSPVPASRWQAGGLPRTKDDFPVDELE